MNTVRKINQYPKLNIRKMIDRLESFDVISFDIFDTLIKRDVPSSQDVFEIAQEKYNFNNRPSIKDFKKARINAENEARKHSRSEEINIHDIYKYMSISFGSDNSFDTSKLLECEKWAEQNLCTKNENFYSIYQYCVKKEKKILLISDTYWDQSFIERLLFTCKIRTYNNLYLSSEIGLTKHSGHLFEYILAKENLEPNQIIHFGDHKISDFLSPIKKGIKACSIPRFIENTTYLHKSDLAEIEGKHIKSFINNRIEQLPDDETRIGYEIYGPLLYTFVKWLSERIDKEKTILFFARDCYVIKPAFEILNPDKKDGIYFFGSRRSMTIPALYNNADLQRVKKFIRSESKQINIEGLLKLLGLNANDYIKELSEFGLTKNTVIDRDKILENQKFVNFYPTIKDKIQENAALEYKGFLNYWNSLNCSNDIQVVDIGWRGTMQYCLKNLLPDSFHLYGYYLGVKGAAYVTECEGLFLKGREDYEKDCLIASIMALIEVFFSAPHGSVKKYNDDGSIDLLPYECENKPESKNFVEKLHKGALSFVKDYSQSEISSLFHPNEKILFSGLKIMGLHPEKRELENFSNYPYRMGVGIVKAAAPKPLHFYMQNPKSFIFDLANSSWRIGFLKKALKIKLPYYSIFSWIYKHRM